MRYIARFSASRSAWCVHWLEESNASSYIVDLDSVIIQKYGTKELAEAKCLQLNEEKDKFLASPSFEPQLELDLEETSE
mgnify:CR=1 FL=1|tara:strand:- start:401 stop:637 length:237 start_codon:yes stop_codon:yes gene_type:complete